MPDHPGPIAYLSRVMPTLSETFVVREIMGLRRLGLTVCPFSLHPPDTGVVHPEAPHLVQEVEVLVQPRNPCFWLAHVGWAARHPRRYFGALRRYVFKAPGAFTDRRRVLEAFMVAPFAAGRFKRAGVRHVHAHFANVATSVAMMAAGLAGISFSFTAHAYDIFADALLLPEKLKSAAFVACISHFNVHYLQARYPEAAFADFQVVRVAVDTQRFQPAPHALGRPPLVLAVGRLVETKGFHTLIEAAALLRRQGIDLEVAIIGDGPEAANLAALIKALGEDGRITLLGARQPEEVMEYYRRADLLAMPSCIRRGDTDGIPTVLMEAMAMEIPVVATRVSGIPELVMDGVTGLLAPPDDPEALAAAMARLLQDRELPAQLARAGRDLVAREFNLERSTRQLLALFGKASGLRPQASGLRRQG